MKGKKALLYLLDFILLFAGVACAGILSLTNTPQGTWFILAVGPLSVVMLVMLLIIVVIEVISIYKVPTSTVHTAYVAITLFLYYLTGFDALRFFSLFDDTPPKVSVEFLNYLCLILAALSVLYFLNYNYKLKISVKKVVFLAAYSLASFVAYALLYFVRLQYIPYLAFFALICILTAQIYGRVISKGEDDLVFHISTTLIYAVCGMGLVDILGKSGLLRSGTVGYQLIYCTVIVLLFATIYISHIVKTEKDARLASEYKLLYERTKINALRGQIKPHFVFNLLSTIKALYRINPDEGDRAVNLFSRHLRANVMAAEKDLISFEDELDFMEIYVELENLKQEDKFNVIYDIDCTDFEVPILGLQPYIENAIKYSRVNEKPDGAITIASHKEGENVILTISDNGVGFDSSTIGDESYGIKNSLTRFELLLGVKPQITSVMGEGTRVNITIPTKIDNTRGGKTV